MAWCDVVYAHVCVCVNPYRFFINPISHECNMGLIQQCFIFPIYLHEHQINKENKKTRKINPILQEHPCVIKCLLHVFFATIAIVFGNELHPSRIIITEKCALLHGDKMILMFIIYHFRSCFNYF